MNALWIVSLLLLVGPAQQAPTSSVEGVVTVAGTEDPLANVVLELRRTDGDPEPLLVASQTNGRFLFQNVPPGRYRLTGTRTGYLPAEFGARLSGGPGAPIVVNAAQPVSNLRLALTPTAAVSGRILDRAGQPVASVVVQVLKAGFQDGRRTLVVVKSMLTNDLGEYRIFWLQPGSYYVNVLPPPDTRTGAGTPLVINASGPGLSRSLWSEQSNVAARPVTSDLPPTEAYLPTFFPGTMDDGAASLVELGPGADLRGIDIRLVPTRAWTVRGVVINGSTGQRGANVGIQLMSLMPSSSRVSQVGSDSMGAFAFSRIPPGPYVLLANSGGLFRQMPVEVRDGDIDVSLEIVAPFTIAARIIAADPGAFVPQLRLDFPVPNVPQLNGAPAADGNFTFRPVPAADYRLYVSPVLPPAGVPTAPVPPTLRNSYVKAMRLGSVDLLNERLRVDRQPEEPIEIVIATDPGSLSGRVVNSRQEPVVAATVVLLPSVELRLHRSDLIRVTSTDEAGRFSIESIPPGEYRGFAWHDIADGAWRDPSFMRVYEEFGRNVRILENGRVTIDLTTAPVRDGN